MQLGPRLRWLTRNHVCLVPGVYNAERKRRVMDADTTSHHTLLICAEHVACGAAPTVKFTTDIQPQNRKAVLDWLVAAAVDMGMRAGIVK